MMKAQDLKYWLLDLHVTRYLLVPTFLLFCANALCQNNVINNKEYYRFIEQIAFESKIIDSVALEKYHDLIKNGKLTQQDSIRFVERKKIINR